MTPQELERILKDKDVKELVITALVDGIWRVYRVPKDSVSIFSDLLILPDTPKGSLAVPIANVRVYPVYDGFESKEAVISEFLTRISRAKTTREIEEAINWAWTLLNFLDRKEVKGNESLAY